MTLLFDHNLSPRLVARLADLYPDSVHVLDLGLADVLDMQIWQYAAVHDYAIVTKDSDFYDLSVMHGTPPKVLWLQTGNCTTTHIETLLRTHSIVIVAFLADPAVGILILH